jgi:PAS domain S-box-containing protein
MQATQSYFDLIFSQAKVNSIVIMDANGIIDRVNSAFTTAYGYSSDDLRSKHFRVLYLEKDQLTRRPEIELNTTHREGSATDENYLVHKDGTPIWVSGESILVQANDSVQIVKIIHNIHAQKQLERFLLSTSELVDSLFDSVQQSGLLYIDASLKVVKMNQGFKNMFHITETITEGAKLQQIPHPFWSSEEIKTDLRTAMVTGTPVNKEYIIENGDREFRHVQVNSKTIIGDDGSEKRILLMIKTA